MRLDTNYSKKKKKTAKKYSWRLLNNKEVTEEIRKEIKKVLDTNDNENKTTQNIWDSAKAVDFVGRIQGAKGPFDLQFLTWDFS